MENKNWVHISSVDLPKPMRSKYPTNRRFVLRNRDKLNVIKIPGEDEFGRGDRIYVDQDEVWDFALQKIKEGKIK